MEFIDSLRQTAGLSFPIGEDESGKFVCVEIDKINHLLVCGATGTGKSYFIHTMLLSLMAHNNPETLKFILFDPKMIEFSLYRKIPHLLIPTISDSRKLFSALQWLKGEVSKRLKLFSETGDRTLSGYNEYLWESFLSDNGMCRIVVVIDDITNAIIEVPEIAESLKQILMQGRTVGVHIVISTQAPRWKETKQIASLFRSKMVFSAATEAESKYLLGRSGAQNLGPCQNAMFSNSGGLPIIIQTVNIKERDFTSLISNIQDEDYIPDEKVLYRAPNIGSVLTSSDENTYDELLPSAIEVIVETQMASVSMIQRRLKLGYSRAARLMDQMEEKGIVGPFEGSMPRQVLITKEQWIKMQTTQGIPEDFALDNIQEESKRPIEDTAIIETQGHDTTEDVIKKESKLIRWLKNEMKLQKEYRESIKKSQQ